MTRTCDIAVIGSGFAGSLIAMIARRQGRRVILLERGAHPRVVIGESSTPLSNLLLEELATRYDLPRLVPLTKWGPWQHSYPELACGLKRGFSFFHHDLGSMDPRRTLQDRQLLVAASPHDAIADTHWFRADVDQWLVAEAQALGAEYLDHTTLTAATRAGDGWQLSGARMGEPITICANLLLDASGPRGFLHRALNLGEQPIPQYPETEALYSHFSGVEEFAAHATIDEAATPYPIDAAALHHVFDGGWMWVLRFNNGLTSAGVAAKRDVAGRYRFEDGEAAWQRVLAALPSVAPQFARARAEKPFTHLPQLAFRSATIAGEGWALLPSAAGFVDPLLSTGFPVALLGVTRLAAVLEADWGSPRLTASIARYAEQTDREIVATARLIAALYRAMSDMDLFRPLSLLYFAAASYAETARRLGKPELAGSFLLADHPRFGPESGRILARVHGPLDAKAKRLLVAEIYDLIAAFDVAGLCARPRDHAYPVRAEDLFSGAHTLGATPEQVSAMLERSGFYATVA